MYHVVGIHQFLWLEWYCMQIWANTASSPHNHIFFLFLCRDVLTILNTRSSNTAFFHLKISILRVSLHSHISFDQNSYYWCNCCFEIKNNYKIALSMFFFLLTIFLLKFGVFVKLFVIILFTIYFSQYLDKMKLFLCIWCSSHYYSDFCY